MKWIYQIVLIVVILLASCDTNEAEFPELLTSEAQEIGRSSVVLEAEIKETGTIRPIEYGFLWDTSGGINVFTSTNKLDLGSTSDKRKFSIKLESLTPNTQYFVRSYASDPDYTKVYYGNEITFTTLN